MNKKETPVTGAINTIEVTDKLSACQSTIPQKIKQTL